MRKKFIMFFKALACFNVKFRNKTNAARVKIPTFLKRFHKMSEGRFVLIEDVIAAFISELSL